MANHGIGINLLERLVKIDERIRLYDNKFQSTKVVEGMSKHEKEARLAVLKKEREQCMAALQTRVRLDELGQLK